MSRKTLIASVVVALLGITLVSWAAPVPPAKDKAATPAEVLLGNTVLVVTDGKGHVLAKPQIRSVSGRSFVVGKAMKEGNYVNEPFPDKVIWVPLDSVREMVELE
jgi:hypothetical protein